VLQAGAELRERQHANFARPGSPSEKIERRIEVLLETLFEDPSLHHLIIERIIHGKSKQARKLRHEMVFGTCKDLSATIDDGVKTGEFRRVDPRHLFLAMVGVCSYAMTERALFGELMGEEPTRGHLESFKAFVTELFLNGLAATTKSRKPRLERIDS
jgi:hypothetical protein